MIDSKLINYTAQKVEKFFLQGTAPAHGWAHVEKVWGYAKEIAQGEKESRGILEMSALLHDIGRVTEWKKNPTGLRHHELSYLLADQWFKKDKKFAVLTDKEKQEILYNVRNHWTELANDYATAALLRDADKLDLFGEHGIERGKQFHAHDWQSLLFGVVANLNRAERLVSPTAKKMLKDKKLLSVYAAYLPQVLPKKKKVLVAMSGGVDSAVAAGYLIKAGFEVTGAFIKCFSDNVGSKSCWIDERRDALRVAAKLGIKLLTFDFELQYKKDVVGYLFKQYRAGRTPNPDVMCNKYVKIPLLLKEAKKLGFDWVATGHYARIKDGSHGEVCLYQSVDANKDQTYFLHQLGQKELKKLLFPLGTTNKNEVRVFATSWGLPVAAKEESMGICFVGEVPMKDFLSRQIKNKKGKIATSSGKIIGEHDGLAFYTVGQRHLGEKNLQLPSVKGETKPLYVVGKDFKKNQLIVGAANDKLLFKKEIVLPKVHWIEKEPKLPLICDCRLRHRQPLQECKIYFSRGKYKINFKEAQRAVTPGQFVVFYKKGHCLGGGEII
ncbi:MAG TPA: tRNA 2-thiouridine(34) synthase MnmA [Candidatus Magasanikbacteria bacterium]|nr:tRNA 2-thiouridine(34) synthase MnmA [Candidatus Magasanikbacteria bacterium]